MRFSPRWVASGCLVITLFACDTPTDSPQPATARRASVASGSGYISQAVALMYDNLSKLTVAREVKATTGSDLYNIFYTLMPYWTTPVGDAAAIAILNNLIAAVNATSSRDMTNCAKNEIIRQSNYIIGMFSRASQLTQYDITPYPHGVVEGTGWPWGGCPAPTPPLNLRVRVTFDSVFVTWDYNPLRGEHFLVYEVLPSGAAQVFFRMDSDDCSNISTGSFTLDNACLTTTRTVKWRASVTGVTARVEACLGMNCAGAEGRGEAPPAPPPPPAPGSAVLTLSAAGNLWPPNHQYVSISVAATINGGSTVPAGHVVTGWVESSEADDANGSGDGNTTGDIRVTRNGTVSVSSNANPKVDFNPFTDRLELRAERGGSTGPRTYTIVFRVQNSAGTSEKRVQLVVPHSQGG